MPQAPEGSKKNSSWCFSLHPFPPSNLSFKASSCPRVTQRALNSLKSTELQMWVRPQTAQIVVVSHLHVGQPATDRKGMLFQHHLPIFLCIVTKLSLTRRILELLHQQSYVLLFPRKPQFVCRSGEKSSRLQWSMHGAGHRTEITREKPQLHLASKGWGSTGNRVRHAKLPQESKIICWKNWLIGAWDKIWVFSFSFLLFWEGGVWGMVWRENQQCNS